MLRSVGAVLIAGVLVATGSSAPDGSAEAGGDSAADARFHLS